MEKKSLNIFVTGATGFVGNHLAETLLKEGHQVWILVRSAHKLNDFPLPGVNIISGELSDKKNLWIDQLPEKLDVVYHAAGVVHSMRKKIFYRHNTQASIILLNDLKERFQSSPLHFIFLSSLAATGPSIQGRYVNEESKEIPVSHYGKSKKEAEKELKRLVPENFKLTIIRPPMVVGPRDTAVLDIFKMVQGTFIVTPGLDGKSKEYSFVCIYDLVKGLVKVMDVNLPDRIQTFFLSYPKKATFKEIVKAIQYATGKKFIFFILVPMPIVRLAARFLKFVYAFYKHALPLTPDKVRELQPTSWCCESEKSVRLLDMRYDYSLSETMRVTAEDYQKRNWI